MIDFLTFFAQEDVQEAVKAKVKKLQEKEFVSKDFETTLDGKRVKFVLPNDVREQMYVMTLAQKWLLDEGVDLEDSHKNSVKFCEFFIKNTLIDGKEVADLNAMDVEDLRAYGLVYYIELLLPLYHRSATKAKDSVKQILKGYLTE